MVDVLVPYGCGMTSVASSRKGRAKREEALRVALEVFAEQGYRRTSLRTVADRAGLSLAGLMHYFDSKESMLTEILRARDQDSRRRFAGGGDRLDYLLATIEHNSGEPGLVALYLSLGAAAVDEKHPAHEFFVGRLRRVRAEIVEYARSRGRAPRAPLTEEAAAQLTLAMIDGIQVQWLADSSIDMAQRIREGIDVLYTVDRGVQ